MGSDSEYTDAHDDMESSEDLSPSGGDGELEINGTDHDGMHHAAKRQKVGDGDHHVARDALHGAADGIDHLQEADASLLQLEVTCRRCHLLPVAHEPALQRGPFPLCTGLFPPCHLRLPLCR